MARKPPDLRLIEGTYRADKHGPLPKKVKGFAKLKMPTGLSPEAQTAWRSYIKPCVWLDKSKEPLAIIFVNLWVQYLADPAAFTAGKMTMLRKLSADLGLTDTRQRVELPDDEEDEFFGD